ncbi:MAG: hypothetical protein IKD90_09695 [Clostridiales bacterium]|nr:hypothetical protein [Clostridiales bacterium]
MKRSIAAILSLSIVLGLAGCKNKGDETRTERSTRTKKTEITETEDTESSEEPTETESETEPSESSETSETTESETSVESDTSETSDSSESSESSKESESSETSDTSAPTPTPASIPKITFSNNLKSLDLKRSNRIRAYSELCPSAGENSMAELKEELEFYQIGSSDFSKLTTVTDAIFDGRARRMDSYYDQALATFHDDVQGLTSDEFWDYRTRMFQTHTRVARADSQIYSFELTDGVSDSYSTQYFNLDSSTGDSIKLDDVVLDRATMAKIVETLPIGEGYEKENLQLAYASIADALSNNKEVDFLLYPNAIQFAYTIRVYDYDQTYFCTIPTVLLGGVVDLKYFGATTKNYSLVFGSNNTCVWDFDGDSTPDVLSINCGDDNSKTIDFMFNNTASSITKENKIYSDNGFYPLYVSVTDNGTFIYVGCSNEDPVDGCLVFCLRADEKIEFIDECEIFDSIPYDPSNCRITPRCDLLGTGHMTVNASILGNNGIPKPIDPFYEKSGVGVTVKEMKLAGYSEEGPLAGDTVTIPKGTSVRMIGIDSANEMALFTTLNENESENVMFYMACWKEHYDYSDEYDFSIHYDGDSAYQLFVGPMYAD